MLQDLRFALRLFNRHRGYAAVAVMTMALGVGANTAIFSIADSVLFRPLPFPDVARLFVLRVANPRTGEVYGTLPGADVDAAQATGLFDRVAAFSGFPRRVYVRRGQSLDALSFGEASIEYVELLGIRPLLGRMLARSDAGSDAVVLTYETWMRQYGGDSSVLGKTMDVVSARETDALPPPLRVVGVLPPSLRLPLMLHADGLMLTQQPAGGAGRATPPLVRLKAGVAPAAAQARLRALTGEELAPGKSELRLVGVREELAVRQDPVLWLLLGASAIVLLVACANLANLVLARGSARARELAVRTALGGSRGRLVRLLAVEAACIAVCGTVAGVFAGYAGFRVLSNQLPPVLAIAAAPAFDLRALAFAAAIAAVATLASGLLPAVRLARSDARDGLSLGRLQIVSPHRGRGMLVAVEIAICVSLLVGAGLVGRSLFALLTQNLGFGLHRVQASFELPAMRLRRGPTLRADNLARQAFMQARLRDARAVPGVRAAAVVSAPPFGGNAPNAPLMAGRGAAAGGVYSVSSDFIRALGMTLVAGRDMTDAESAAGSPVGVLNERGAAMLCGGPATCIGRIVNAPRQPPRTVIGVVRDARLSVQDAPLPAMYVPFDPAVYVLGSIVIDADDTPAVREQLSRTLSASKDARVELRSLDAARDRELSPFRFNAIVVGGFALLTLGLAVVGVYGVMASVVGERTREYGIRMALGATRDRISRHVLGQTAAPVGGGVAAGMILASWGSKSVSTLLYGVVPLDAVSYIAAAVVIVASGFAAACVPARRAGRVDPIVALKVE